jgi:2-desacetyl-2-hydroxyethyl bacteriochlorophyllide A dehydrogenase
MTAAWPEGEMSSIVIAAPMTVESRPTAIPPEAPGEVLVRTGYVGICGTDVELLHGTSFYLTEQLNRYPVIFGHEWAGTVVAIGEGVRSVSVGDRVIGQTILTCGECRMCRRGRRTLCENHAEMGLFGHDGAAAEYVRVPARSLVVIPPELSLRDAALIEPSVTVVHGLARVRCAFDDRVVVIGTGTLGLVAVQVAGAIAESVDVIGIEEKGLALARELGASRAFTPEGAPYDAYTVAVEASGTPSAVALVPRLLEAGGRAALIGVVNERALDFIPSFVTLKDLELHGILHGLDHYDRTVALFASGRVTATHLIDRVLPASAAADAFERLIRREIERPKLLLEFAGDGR